MALVASTHPPEALSINPIPMWFGGKGPENYTQLLSGGIPEAGGVSVGLMMTNSLIMALLITVGKIAVSLTAAFAIVYFRFRFRFIAFWLIFTTLMLPVEVRILPTFDVVASLGMLNSYTGLCLPLIASATATFASSARTTNVFSVAGTSPEVEASTSVFGSRLRAQLS